MIKKQKISIVGLGYVGLPLALLASKKGFDVIGIDLDGKKINKINARIDPLKDEYVASHITSTSMKAVSNFSSISQSSIVVICVPTPIKEGYQPDLKILESAVISVAEEILPGTLVVIESTINPGVCDEVVIPLIEKHSKFSVNKDFYVSHCPERINPGDPNWNVENIPRVVGSSNEIGLNKTVDFYTKIIDAKIKEMSSIKEAEAVKIVENSFRDINIAFVNELAMSFTMLGINVKNVIDGASTKPFAFMAHYPSIGVGGHCIPVDPYYLIEYARGFGFEHEFLSLARSINNRMPEFTVERLIDGLNEAGIPLAKARILVLGLSYKADVADDRESPSYRLINILKHRGVVVDTFDPFFIEKSTIKKLGKNLGKFDALILATNHSAFKKLDFSNNKVIVDGKNFLDREIVESFGVIYRGVGT